jgi:hypothetical protein
MVEIKKLSKVVYVVVENKKQVVVKKQKGCSIIKVVFERMKNSRFWDVLLKVLVAAITAAATALTTTSCMGQGPLTLW